MLELCLKTPKEKPKSNDVCLLGDVVDSVVMFRNNQGGGDDVGIQLESFPEYACSNYLNDKLGEYKIKKKNAITLVIHTYLF